MQDKFYKCVTDNGFKLERGIPSNRSHIKTEDLVNKENSILSKYENEIDKTALDVSSSMDETITISKGEYNSLIARIEALENKSTNGFEMKQLVDYINTPSWTSVETNDSISNYNYLYLVFGTKSEWYDSRIIKLDEFIKDYSNTYCNLFFYGGKFAYAHFQYVDDNHIKICCNDRSATGVKIDFGHESVEML